MNSYRDLEAWKVGIQLLKEVYRLTALLPAHEQYGLTSQLRRASSSILANLAEGFGRFTYPDKANKYTIARGECSEVDAFISMLVELRYCTSDQCTTAFSLIQSERKLLSGLISACRKRS